MLDLVFDALLCALIVGAAFGAVAGARTLFTGVSLFIVYGLLLALAWVRLGAIDVALAEAAIGAGLTGVLLLRAAALLQDAADDDPEAPQLRRSRPSPLIALGAAAVAAALAGAGLSVQGGQGLTAAVQAELPRSGVDNPVTAVLLNFRGYDTLLESLVLAVALIAVWSLTPDGAWGGRPSVRQHVRPGGVLATFGRLLPPFGLIVGLYLVWTGADAPGGAFQGGTVLAAVWLLAAMAGLVSAPQTSSLRLRLTVIFGPLVFLLAGLWGLSQGGFLTFPTAIAKPLILAIELALTLSIAATLALLVLGPPQRRA